MSEIKQAKLIFRKGNLVQTARHRRPEFQLVISGFYSLTVEEVDQWREQEIQSIRAGKILGHNSAGETRLAPTHLYQRLDPDVVYVVLRGRCNVSRDFLRGSSSRVKILDTETGRELYCIRSDLRIVG